MKHFLFLESSEAEEESSSDDDKASRLLASRSKRVEETATSSHSETRFLNLHFVLTLWNS